jgi:hypothetical protein
MKERLISPWTILPIIAFTLKVIEWHLAPLPGIDAFLDLGELFTSDKIPYRDYFYNSGSRKIGGYLGFLFYRFFNSEHSVFYFYLSMSAIAYLMLLRSLSKVPIPKKELTPILLALIFCPFIFNQRAEVIGLIFSLMFTIITTKNNEGKINSIGTLFFLVLSYFAHPVCFVTCLYISLIHLKGKKVSNLLPSNKFEIFILVAFILALSVFFIAYISQEGVFSWYTNHLIYRLTNPSPNTFLQFIIYSSPLAILTFNLLFHLRGVDRWLFIGFLLLLTVFKRDFYFIYVIPIYVSHIQKNQALNMFPNRTFLIFSFTVPLYITFLNPIILKLENKSYRQVSQHIYNTLRKQEIPEDTEIHIDPIIASAFVFRDNTTSLIIGEKETELYPRKDINVGDIVYMKSPYQVKRLSKEFTISQQILIPPVLGKLTARSFYQNRQDSLGLFKCSIKSKVIDLEY